LAVTLSCSNPEEITGPQIQPVAYIVKENLGSNLTNFAYRTAQVTQTYKIIQSKVGKSEAKAIIEKELDKAIKIYQQQWNDNFALAHSEHLSIKEINSLYYNGKYSPYSEKRSKLQSKIGTTMQSLSKDLLTKVVSEALQDAYKKVIPE